MVTRALSLSNDAVASAATRRPDHVAVDLLDDAGRPAATWTWGRLSAAVDETAASLAADGIETRVFYPLPLHLQPCFRDLDYREGSLPESERAAADVLSLPMRPSLDEGSVERVCDALERALGEHR